MGPDTITTLTLLVGCARGAPQVAMSFNEGTMAAEVEEVLTRSRESCLANRVHVLDPNPLLTGSVSRSDPTIAMVRDAPSTARVACGPTVSQDPPRGSVASQATGSAVQR